jgi:hypothetical protein
LPSTLSLSPLQRLDLGQLLSFTDEFIHGNESGGLDAGDLEEENPVAAKASAVGSLEGGLEEGHASEERDSTGGLELVLELLGGVGGAGGGDDAGQAVDGVREGDIINLNKTRDRVLASVLKRCRILERGCGWLTALTENTATTFSQGVASLGANSSRLPIARDRKLVRSLVS